MICSSILTGWGPVAVGLVRHAAREGSVGDREEPPHRTVARRRFETRSERHRQSFGLKVHVYMTCSSMSTGWGSVAIGLVRRAERGGSVGDQEEPPRRTAARHRSKTRSERHRQSVGLKVHVDMTCSSMSTGWGPVR